MLTWKIFNTTSSQFFFRWSRERSEGDKWSPARKSGNATGKPDSPRSRETGKAGLGAGDTTRETKKASLGAGVAENERARGGSVEGRGPLYV